MPGNWKNAKRLVVETSFGKGPVTHNTIDIDPSLITINTLGLF